MDKCKICKSDLLTYPEVKLCPKCQEADVKKLALKYMGIYKAFKNISKK